MAIIKLSKEHIILKVLLLILLSSNIHSSFLDDDSEELFYEEKKHQVFSRIIAHEGMVLAVNNGLPLLSTDQVVIFGKGSKNTIYGGLGSGEVYQKGTRKSVNCIQMESAIETKAKRRKFNYIKNNEGFEIGLLNSKLTDEKIKKFSIKKFGAKRSVAVFTISRLQGEGFDRNQDDGIFGTKLTKSEKITYNSLINYFDIVVVVLNVGSVIELEGIEKNNKTSILIAFYPGMMAGGAICDVLTGEEIPCGHLTDTWAEKIDDYITTNTFNENKNYVKYKEGLFVGYRYFEDSEEQQKKVVFPFGHGLSYTTFQIISTSVEFNYTEDDNGNNTIFNISCYIKNTGDNFKGKQVVQIYVEKPQNENFIKAKRELVAFGKTKVLYPNEVDLIYMTVNLYDLASYDDTGVTGNKACYVLEEGEYKFYIGFSVADTRNDSSSLLYVHKQTSLIVTKKLTNRLVPTDPEVLDSNTKPDFTELLNNKFINNDNETKTCLLNSFYPVKYAESKITDQYNEAVDEEENITFYKVLKEGKAMEDLVEEFSDEDLAYLSFGHRNTLPSGTGTIGGTGNYGPLGKFYIPYGDTLDGPAGLRHSSNLYQSTAWPCATLLASTFDVDLIEKLGQEIGKESRKFNCSFWLAPGMNIHRSPLCGRNFEYYSEDPLLTGKVAAAMTRGVQSKRVSITLKHFAFNNKEYNRKGEYDYINFPGSDSRVSERVAREIYLKGFEIAVKEGDPWSIMSSYNSVNGIKTAQNFDLLTGILRKEWGFEGMVMTDWNNWSEIEKEIMAGGNVKMPRNYFGIKSVVNGLKKGTINRDNLKKSTTIILKTLSKTFVVDKVIRDTERRKYLYF